MVKKLQGVYAVTCTPFTEDDEVDEEALRRHIRFLLDEGKVHGIIPTGSTGEFASLSEDERKRVVDITIDEVNGKVPVVVGSAAVTTRDTIMYCRHAEKAGADGVMIVHPYYCLPTERELYEHYKAIAASIGIPIMIYNNPATSGVDMQPELLARLAEIDNISYVKEASGDVKRIGLIKMLCGDKITIFIGTDHNTFEAFVMGTEGWVAGAANVIPKQCVKLYELAVEKRDIDGARELWYCMLPFGNMVEGEGKFVQYLKAASEMLGRPLGPPRRPLLPPLEEDRRRLKEALDRVLG